MHNFFIFTLEIKGKCIKWKENISCSGPSINVLMDSTWIWRRFVLHFEMAQRRKGTETTYTKPCGLIRLANFNKPILKQSKQKQWLKLNVLSFSWAHGFHQQCLLSEEKLLKKAVIVSFVQVKVKFYIQSKNMSCDFEYDCKLASRMYYGESGYRDFLFSPSLSLMGTKKNI